MNHNDSIHCTVTECKFHCNGDDYCTLQKINIVKNNNMASSIESTDCASSIESTDCASFQIK